jgi:glycosyltransferase involved in cell wall biosynthesis
MQKVFHIISHFDMGGAERVALNIAESDAPDIEYHVVEVVRGRSPFTSDFISEMRSHHIHYHRAWVPQVRFHYVFERLAALTFPVWFLFLFLRHRPTVIHCHTEVPDMAVWVFFSLFPLLLRHCLVVRTLHNTQLWTGLEGTGRRVERFMQRHARIVAISPSVQQSYRDHYGLEAPIIFNGVAPTAQEPFAGIIKNKVNVLFAGRLEPQKGVSALAATIKVMADNASVVFHVVGAGSLEGWLRGELEGLTNVRFYAPIYGLPRYMASFQFLFMPSLFEGLSIQSIEASMNGLPVVANRCPGLIDTLPPDWPLAVDDNNITRYCELFRISPEQRKACAESARQFVDSHFSIHLMQQRYEAIYRKGSI